MPGTISLISSLNSHLREKHSTQGLRFIAAVSSLEGEGMGFKKGVAGVMNVDGQGGSGSAEDQVQGPRV